MAESSIQEALATAFADAPPTTIMEVCGTHTHAIARHGLRRLLPENLRLVSGPGCPVCVTDDGDIRAALRLARLPGVSVFTFGDMLRVPVNDGGGADSLYRAKGLGSDVRMAVSPMDALAYAKAHPEREVVWFGVGFETTAPLTAALVLKAGEQEASNLSVLCAHKTMPAALIALLDGAADIHALLCPGHVAVITGADAFGFVPQRLHMPGVIAGFEPEEIARALIAVAGLRKRGTPSLANGYTKVVTPEGNIAAQSLMRAVFAPCAARWRGMGEIPKSGLELREAFAFWDARRRFDLKEAPTADAAPPSPCRCADVLRGALSPRQCPLFHRSCTPDNPTGPCMVSSEGACSAEYLYGGE